MKNLYFPSKFWSHFVSQREQLLTVNNETAEGIEISWTIINEGVFIFL